MRRLSALLAALVLLTGCSITSTPTAPASGTPATATPTSRGALNPDVTQATAKQTICVPGWSDSVRPDRLPLAPKPGFEVDHIVPISLGGATSDRANLWYEPQLRARQVDVLETALHRLVCRASGPLPLAAAQAMAVAVKGVP